MFHTATVKPKRLGPIILYNTALKVGTTYKDCILVRADRLTNGQRAKCVISLL